MVASGATLAVNVGGTGEWTTGTSGNGTIGGLLGGLGGQSGSTVTYAGTATVGFDTSNATSTQSYAGVIANVGTTLGIIKLGSNTLQLTGANTYTGATTVNDGTLEVKNTGGTTISQTLGALTLAGGDVTLQSTWDTANSISTTFTSLVARVAGNTAIIAVSGGSPGTTNTLKISGGVAGALIDKGVFFGGNSYAAYGTSNVIRAYGSGDTGYLAAPTNPTMGSPTATSNVDLTTGNITAQTTAAANTINLRANSLTLSNTSQILSVNGILSAGSSSAQIATAGTLQATAAGNEIVIRVNGGSDALSIAPVIQNYTAGGTASALTKSGAGTLTLSGTNTYTGQTYVNGGTLSIGANVNLGAQATGAQLNLRGGTLQATGTFGLYNGSAGTNNRAVVLTDAAGFDVTGSNTLTVAGVVSGTGSLTKTNTGTLSLSNTNSYNGATAVNAGTLAVSGSIGSSAVTVNNTGTVLASGATGTIGSSVVVNSGAIVAPGNAGAAGTATVTGATTFNDGSIFSWDISAAGTSYDKLVSASLVDGDSAGGAVLRIVAADASFANAFWNTPRTWTDIFTTNGSTPIANWANIFTSVSLVNSSFTPITPAVPGAFVVSGNTLTWTAVPEPTTALAGLLLGTGLMRRRRDSGLKIEDRS